MAPGTSTSSEEILIVDDMPANLRLLSQILSGRGFRVRAVTSGLRALESARLDPPSLILLDIRMPEMDGIEVCARLKAEEATRDIPVIFISALDNIQDKVQAFTSGGVDYITKPFQIEEVLVRTETHLTLRKLQKQLIESNKRFARELDLAGKIQAGFLPRSLPDLPDWEIQARLVPARETSGDFYDVISLPDGKLGFLIADVVDKGVGAALFMGLCLSLFRTYLLEFPTQPACVFNLVNHRILTDTQADQFVTVFLGVLDPATGRLVYSNAGQCPGLLLGGGTAKGVQKLTLTGIPLGVQEEETWEQRAVEMLLGDVLVLYTDGITEMQNLEGVFFGADRLVTVAKAGIAHAREDLQAWILEEIGRFLGGSQPEDDIALLILRRVVSPS